jgi:hypothetical protein
MSRDPQINVRLPADLKEAVQKMAEDNKRSVNAEIVSVLLESVKMHNATASDIGDAIHEGDLQTLREIIRVQSGLLSDYRDVLLKGTEIIQAVSDKAKKPK